MDRNGVIFTKTLFLNIIERGKLSIQGFICTHRDMRKLISGEKRNLINVFIAHNMVSYRSDIKDPDDSTGICWVLYL